MEWIELLSLPNILIVQIKIKSYDTDQQCETKWEDDIYVENELTVNGY